MARSKGQATRLTPRELASLPVGKWLSDPSSAEGTALEARALATGVKFYIRWRDPAGKVCRYVLGAFDAEGVNGLTVAQARDKARDLGERVRSEGRDLRAMIEADTLRHRRELDAEEARKRAAEEAATAGATRSLGIMVNAYVASLEARGAARWKDVRNACRLHLEQHHPDLWATPADNLIVEDLLIPVARLVGEGKARQAAMIRSHLQAAYNAAIRARTDASAPDALRKLKITTNPGRDLATVRGAIRAKDRALSAEELRAYWRHLQALNDPHRSLLVAHLLLGGQRMEQLGRLTVDDWDRRQNTLTLRDSKGRRALPRLHVLPILPPVAAALAAMRRAPAGQYLWTLTQGKSGCSSLAAGDACERVCSAMMATGEALERFTLGDIRRTIETLLAGFGTPQEVRAQLQSHGLSGVQHRHYDRADYMEDKLQSLRLIWALCDPDAEQADRTERERLAKLAAGATVLAFRRSA